MSELNKYLDNINKYIYEKEYKYAISICEYVIEDIGATDIIFIYKKAYCYYKLEKYNIALINFFKVDSVDNNNAMCKYYIGKCYYKLNSVRKAIEYFKDALKLDATNEYFFLWVGISYIQIAKNNNDYNIALDYLFKALAFRNYLAYEYISYCYIKLENYKDALIYLEKSIEYNGNDYSTRYYLFYVYFILRNYDEALYHLKISIELKKDEFDSWFMLGILYKIRGEDKKLYRRAFSNARKIAIHCNDDSLTVVYLEKLMKADINNYLNYLYLGIFTCRASKNSSDLKYSLFLLNKALKLNKKHRKTYLVYYTIGHINYEFEEYKKAIYYLLKSIKFNKNKDNYFKRLYIGMSYFKLGKYKKALIHLLKASKFNSTIEVYNLIKDIYKIIGDNDNYDKYLKKIQNLKSIKKEKKSYINNKYLEHFNSINSDSIFYDKAFYNRVDVKRLFSNFDNSIININNFVNFLFEDIESSKIYNSRKADSFVNFDNLKLNEFIKLSIRVKNTTFNSFIKNDYNMSIISIIDDSTDVSYIENMIKNIDSFFEYASIAVLNNMHLYYGKYDIKLYYILMRLMIKNI